MTEESKAEELIEKFYDLDQYNKTPIKYCKQCAIICCEEIINALKITTGHCELRSLDYHEVQMDFQYWQKVKEILNTL